MMSLELNSSYGDRAGDVNGAGGLRSKAISFRYSGFVDVLRLTRRKAGTSLQPNHFISSIAPNELFLLGLGLLCEWDW